MQRPLESPMKKFILAASAALIAGLSIVGPATARDRLGHEDNWRYEERYREHRHRHRDRDTGFRDDGRHYTERYDWRGDRPRRHHGWRNDGWRYGGPDFYLGAPPTIVYEAPVYVAPYCFKKKVYREDAWGNLYVKRVRVCR